MAPADNRHSVVIGWSRIILPLAALALLSTLFLFSRQGPQADRIPFSDLAEIAREPRITGPTFAGLADDGSVVSLRAEEIRPLPGEPDGFGVTGIALSVTAPDGTAYQVSAREGRIDGAGQSATFAGPVRLTSSGGFSVETAGAHADLRAGTVRTEGGLAVQTPVGRLDAAKLLITADSGGRGTRLLFEGGVRLLYEPRP